MQIDETGAEHARLDAVGWGQIDDRHARRLDVVIDREDLAAVDPDILARRVEATERIDDANTAQDGVHGCVLRRSHAPSTPSISRMRTKTRSPGAVGTFLPT